MKRDDWGPAVLYALSSTDRAWVKVGCSTNLALRRRDLALDDRMKCPTLLIGTTPSTFVAESALHRCLRPFSPRRTPEGPRELYRFTSGLRLLLAEIFAAPFEAPSEEQFLELRERCQLVAAAEAVSA